jgi:hypothetical protein
MQRDSVSLPPRRRSSERASRQFFHLSSVVANVFVPTDKQVEDLDDAYALIGNFVADSPEFRDITIEVHGQGSRQIGTLVRPLHARELGFDVDAVLVLKRSALQRYDGPAGARRLIDDLHTVLNRYAERHGLKIEKWERCVTLIYADGVRVDVAPVIEDPLVAIPSGATHSQIPDRLLQRYAPTNPRGLERGFNASAAIAPVFTSTILEARAFEKSARGDVTPLPDADVVSSRLLSIFVQLMKVHRNITFGAPKAGEPDLAPSSVFITVLAAAAYKLRAQQPHDYPMDLLLDVFETMLMCFQREVLADGSQRWSLPNPWAPGDDFATSMNKSHKQKAFMDWHKRFCDDVGALLDALEQRAGNEAVEELVHKSFGSRAASAVRDDSAPAAATRHPGRPVAFATAAGTMTTIAAHANTNFGSAR